MRHTVEVPVHPSYSQPSQVTPISSRPLSSVPAQVTPPEFPTAFAQYPSAPSLTPQDTSPILPATVTTPPDFPHPLGMKVL